MFQHYIITRFNLRREDWTVTKGNEKVLSEEWLEERFELFENYCFSSVKNQINQNFKWFVFFDINTPEKYKIRIAELTSEFDKFYPFFIDGMDMFLLSIKEKVNELTTENYIITSRLDNDDSLHKDYVDEVQSYFDNQDYMAVDLMDGYTLQTGSKVQLGRKRQAYNPFASLIEKKDSNFKSVWHIGHGAWKYEKNIISIPNKRLWLSVIHTKNKVNEFTGFGNVDSKILSDFSIVQTKIDELEQNAQNVNQWKMLSRSNWFDCYYKYYFREFKKIIGLYKIKVLFSKNRYD